VAPIPFGGRIPIKVGEDTVSAIGERSAGLGQGGSLRQAGLAMVADQLQ